MHGHQQYQILIVLLVAFAASVIPVVSTLDYPHGQAFRYNYLTTVQLDGVLEDENGVKTAGVKNSDVAFQLAAEVVLTSVWQNPRAQNSALYRLQLAQSKVKVHPKGTKTGFEDHASKLDQLASTKHDLLFLATSGKIEKVFSSELDTVSLVGLKKGVASLFQFQVQSGNSHEVDVSGRCEVTYKISGRNILKTKNGCKSQTHSDATDANKILRVLLTSGYETKFELSRDEPVLNSAFSEESHVLYLNGAKNAQLNVLSKQTIEFVDQSKAEFVVTGANLEEAVQSVSQKTGGKYLKQDLSINDEVEQCTVNCNMPLTDLVAHYREKLSKDNMGKHGAGTSFLQLVKAFRNASSKQIAEVFSSPDNKNIVLQLLDVAAAAQTGAAFDGVKKVLDYKTDNIENLERFLLASSVVPRPSADLVQYLLKLVQKEVKNDKLKHTVLLVLGVVTSNFRKQPNLTADNRKMLNEVTKTLTEKLEACTTIPCKVQYLSAIGSTRISDVLPVLGGYINEGGQTTTAALQAIGKLPVHTLSNETKASLEQVLYQVDKKYDSTSRILAADLILMSKPDWSVLRKLVKTLANQDAHEVSTYLLNRINELAEFHEDTRAKLKSILNEVDSGNYHVLAQNGLSTAFTHPLATTKSALGTYGLHMEMAKGGVLKQSAFDVDVRSLDSNHSESLNVLSFGLFATGMGGLGTSNDAEPEEEEEKEEMSAGIQLSVLGTPMRPYVFFTSQSEVMGLVWAGAGSEPTEILQGNYLLHDFNHPVVLQNGLVLKFGVTGALSLDIKGSVQISIWSRTSHSVIENKGALVVHSSARINTEFIRSSAEFSVGGEGKLDFITDLEFYEAPFKMCTQMSQASFTLRNNIRTMENIPETQHFSRHTRRRTQNFDPKSYTLHAKNSESCSKMMPS